MRVSTGRNSLPKRAALPSDVLRAFEGVLSGALVAYLNEYKKPPTKKLEATTNEEIHTTTTRICKVHATVLQPDDLWRGFNYGGKCVSSPDPRRAVALSLTGASLTVHLTH